jgi:hypothetical protein
VEDVVVTESARENVAQPPRPTAGVGSSVAMNTRIAQPHGPVR